VDIYRWIETQLLARPHVQGWPELQELVRMAVAARPRHWLLPVVACQSVGGEVYQALPGSMAIACLHTAILVVDDMLDSDPRGIHNQVGHATASNIAVALQAIGLDAIASSEHSEEIRSSTLHSLNQMLCMTAFGQHLDIQNPVSELSYWETVRMKSAPFFGAALHVGALMGGGTGEEAVQLRTIGELYGEMIQISDDLDDVMESPAGPDWTEGRITLPILYAQSVPHPEQGHFEELRRLIPAPDALAAAQDILIRCGAVSYSVYQILGRYDEALNVLAQIPLAQADLIHKLIEEIAQPVKSLLAESAPDTA